MNQQIFLVQVDSDNRKTRTIPFHPQYIHKSLYINRKTRIEFIVVALVVTNLITWSSHLPYKSLLSLWSLIGNQKMCDAKKWFANIARIIKFMSLQGLTKPIDILLLYVDFLSNINTANTNNVKNSNTLIIINPEPFLSNQML